MPLLCRLVVVSLLATFVAAAAGPASASDLPVDIELVLAVDVSGSIDPEEAALQRRGYVEALTHPDVVKAVRGGPFGRIAVTYMEWAGEHHQRIVVAWRLIEDGGSAADFAVELQAQPQHAERWTSISAAIDLSSDLFECNGFEGLRRVIDVSGDGYNNSGRPVGAARDEAVARGITINGLPILNGRPGPGGWPGATDLDAYYEANVIGGAGAFIVPAADFDAFATAIRTKLVREIADLPGAGAAEGEMLR